MFKKFSVLTTTLAIVATLTFGASAKAETPAGPKATATPTAKPQNTIVNTSKAGPKDLKAPTPSPAPSPKSSKQSKTDKGWDGKVQGAKKLNATPTATPTPAKSR